MIRKSFVKAALAAAAVVSLSLPTVSSASLVYNDDILLSAQGFGAAPRALTLQATGQNTVGSGGVGYDGSTITFGGSYIVPDADVFMGNGTTNSTSTDALPSPQADNQKYGIPTIGSLGIDAANDIGILFNATDSAGNGINVVDVTLKFYHDDGTLLGAIDGGEDFTFSNAGNGVAGFVFVVDEFQSTQVNSWLLLGGSSTVLALEATLSGFNGGPESFTIVNLNGVPPIPEPSTYALMLAGLGAIGYMARRRRNG